MYEMNTASDSVCSFQKIVAILYLSFPSGAVSDPTWNPRDGLTPHSEYTTCFINDIFCDTVHLVFLIMSEFQFLLTIITLFK